MKRLMWLAALSFLASSTFAAQDVKEYFAHGKFKQVKLSPNGKNIAFTYQESSEVKLATMSLADKKVLSSFGLGENMHVLGFHWGNDERIVFSAGKVTGNLDNMGRPSHYYAANIDGTKRKQIFTNERSSIQFLHDLPQEEKYILIAKRHWSDHSVKVHKLNIYNGDLEYLADQPAVENIVAFAVDNSGAVRIGLEYVEGNETDSDNLILHIKNGDKWRKLGITTKRKKPDIRPLGFSADNSIAYFSSNSDSESPITSGVFQYSFTEDKISFLERNPVADVTMVDEDYRGAVIGFGYMPGHIERTYIDESDDFTKFLKGLRAKLPDSDVTFTSFTADGSQAIAHAHSDRNPGTFYLVNIAERQVKFLADVMPSLDKKALVPMQPIEYEARDGLKIRGYLTMPAGVTKAPLIINVHGGPFGVRDDWGFNPEAQFFASRGYATLQVNYRGSGGYGVDFERAGYRQWGWKMQDDVTDATLWAIKQGYTDADKVCIYGGSYGGYATLRGITKEPDLYRCAVGYVGVYDMEKFFDGDGSDASRSDDIENYLVRQVAETEKDRVAISPVRQVDKIKTPLFLVHGKNDVRVPMVHFERLTEELDKIGYKYEQMVKPEGHGFYRIENREALYGAMLKFFDKHIGQGLAR